VACEVRAVSTQGEYTSGSSPYGAIHDTQADSEEVQHSGGGWEAFEVEFPMHHRGDNWDTHDVAVFFRVKGGTSGQAVKLDNFKHSYDYTNARTFPDTTIGVAEWVKDDRDLYVGARLWVKVA